MSTPLPTLASSTHSETRPYDEDYINKSLLASLDAQADAEPLNSMSDSESGQHQSLAPASNSSSSGSPPLPYHIAMQSQQQPFLRPDSPSDNINNIVHSHHPIHPQQESLYNLPSQSQMYNTHPDYSSDVEQRQHHSGKTNGFGQMTNGLFKPSGYPFSNSARPRHPQSSTMLPPSNSLRDGQTSYYPNEAFSPQLTSPTQQHVQPFDPRASYDFGGPQPSMVGSSHKPYGLDSFTAGGANPNIFPHQTSAKGLSHNQITNGYSIPTNAYGGVQISSQTPYGPHVPTSVQAAALNGSVAGAPHSLSSSNGLNLLGGGSARNEAPQEEISTIFVVGFPDDMHEREFQNMFTFSSGFEAATLKIPNANKDMHGFGSTGFGGRNGPGYSNGYMGPNDPYNLVTVNQGGVVVDNGRDGMMSSWPPGNAVDDGLASSQFMGQNGLNLPRKQIIGFAKFKSREEALAARDVLQGKRVDLEKGAVLKAEMARKNLHTKRGVGPVSGIVGSSGLDMGSGSLSGVGSLQQGLIGGIADSLSYVNSGNGVELTTRERSMSVLDAMNLNAYGGRWREQLADPSGQVRRDEEDRRREREAGLLNAMGLSSRGAREKVEEEEGQRRRKLRANNTVAYDAFHSVPPMSRQISQANNANMERGIPNGVVTANGYSFSGLGQYEEGLGPWDQVVKTAPLPISSSSQRSSSPHLTSSSFNSNPDPIRSFSPLIGGQDHHHSQSQSSSSSMVGPTQVTPPYVPGAIGEPTHSLIEASMTMAMSSLAVSTNNGNTSPQLPSPASGSSSGGSGRNGVDRNPPISTLYVGNLPNTPPPTGHPHDSLEDRLRDLFKSQIGFRKMCFSQKSNGPMCFVEFEDVPHATKALQELYGHTLNGLVKGGIRLSYSKNPLGVRTPTSAGSNGPSMQQQQLQGVADQQPVEPFPSRFDDQVRPTILRRDTNPPSQPSYMASPPPRFVSPTPSAVNYGATGTIPHLLSRGSQPNLQSYASSFSPFGMPSPPFDSTGPEHNAH